MKDIDLIGQTAHFNRIGGKDTRTVNPPLYTGSTVLFDNYEDFLLAGKGQYGGIVYGTDRLPTQRAFEEAMMKLEGGALTRTFQSGINAIINGFLAFTSNGDHILVCDNVYGPTRRFCRKVLTRYGVDVEFLPPDVGADIDRAIRPNTRVIFLESPGSNTFEIQDIPAITRIAREKDIVTMLDNTWATPLHLRPFDLGLDVSIQSVTKYICGHSDVLLGTVTVNHQYAETFDRFYQVMENFASPQDCYLALRGLRTLGVRLKKHSDSALKVAKWLEQQELIEKVLHPALPGHPQHHLWLRDFSGSSGLFAFLFKKEYTGEEIGNFINTLQHFGIGYSWGGFKSLITAGKYYRATPSACAEKTVIRLNIGLEEPEELIADLARGFAPLIRNE